MMSVSIVEQAWAKVRSSTGRTAMMSNFFRRSIRRALGGMADSSIVQRVRIFLIDLGVGNDNGATFYGVSGSRPCHRHTFRLTGSVAPCAMTLCEIAIMLYPTVTNTLERCHDFL